MRAAQAAAFDAMYEVAHDVYAGIMGTEIDLTGISDCTCRMREPYAVHVAGLCMTCGKKVGLTDEQLIYQFHAAGIWTPEEIEETMLVYARSTYMAPLMNVPQEQMEYIINGVMLDRFQQERRGMWGRAI